MERGVTAPTPTVTGGRNRVVEGITCIVVGMMLFVAQDGMMKSLLLTYPVWMLIVARAVVAAIVLIPLIWWLGAPHRLLTPLWPWHLLRALLFSVGFSFFYAAFPFMGLAEVSTLFFSAPLLTALLAALLLGEKVGPHRIGALVVGFVGVVIAMNPGGDAFRLIAVFPLICAATYALSLVIVRKIGEQESSLTVGLYTVGLSGLMIAPGGWIVNQLIPMGPEFHHLRWAWPLADWEAFVRLAILGVNGMVAYILLSRAYQVTSASIVAPFDYSYLPMAAVMAYVLWDEVPSSSTLTGMALIISSGLYIGWREIRTSRIGLDRPPTAVTAVAPGNPLPDPMMAVDIDE
jgi:drug/metabolite transporter (DMT)-like permease